MSKAIHLISFDVPYPPIYGGVIDVFYKIKALKEAGVEVTLHCFEYGKGEQAELKKYCKKIFYYKRPDGIKYFFRSLPYIVATRNSEELLCNLLKDKLPVLFEGLHTCFHLSNPSLKDRKKIVRMHNVEHRYYASLARAEKNFSKKIYFQTEAQKLKKFESILRHANTIAAISQADGEELSLRYKNVKTVSAFHQQDKVDSKPGKGNYILYHGNLRVPENNQAALFLAKEVLKDSTIPFIIAGNGASDELKNYFLSNPRVQLRENISAEEMHSLIQNAHINLLPTFQATGIKLKLLAALFSGRFCVVNPPMVKNTGLEPLCIIADSAAEMKVEVNRLMHVAFTDSEISFRGRILHDGFSNQTSVKKLLEII